MPSGSLTMGCAWKFHSRNDFWKFERSFVPEGQDENSPAFQRRERRESSSSPEGTAERPRRIYDVSFCRPYGTCVTFRRQPSVETLGYYRMSLRDRSRHPDSGEFPKGFGVSRQGARQSRVSIASSFE